MMLHSLSKRHFWMVCAVLTVLLVLSLVLLEKTATYYEPKIKAAFLLNDEGERRAITLPFSERSPDNKPGVYEYDVELEWKKGDNTRFRVIPDDYLESITVNGKYMPEERYSGSGRGDWQKGLIIDFDSYLNEGVNKIRFKIADYGGDYSIAFRGAEFQYAPSFLRIAAFVLIIVFVLALVFLILHRSRMDKILIGLILLALAWQLISLAMRDYRSHAHDLLVGTGHIAYIHHIADKGTLPPSYGHSYYHPPLYYIISAGVFSFAKALDLIDPYKPLQLLSLVFYWVFLAYSLRLLAQFVRQPWIYRVAAALLLFWPAGELAALRIGNDALLYPLFMMALFYGQRWFVDEKRRDLFFASIACGVGFFAKVSILPLGIILGCLVLWRLYKKHATLSVRSACLALAIIGGCFFLSAVDNWVYGLKASHPKWYMMPFHNASLDTFSIPQLDVQNRVIDFVVPDIKAWFDVAYISPWENSPYSPGRENFWNYMLKTSLYGEWGEQLRPGLFWKKYMAPFINIVFVFLFILACYGLPMLWRHRLIHPMGVVALATKGNNALRKHIRRSGRCLGRQRSDSQWSDFRFVLAVSAFLLLLLVGARINLPSPAMVEFRYVVPVMPVIVVAVASGLMRLQRYRWRFIFANILVLSFVLASFILCFGR